MNKILLVSEDYVKTNSALNDNTFGKYLLPAIYEAQNIGLRRIIGDCLLDTIVGMVADGSIRNDENATYKQFLDEYIQDYLLYETQYQLIPYLNVKLSNIGSVVSNDEHIQTLSKSDIELIRNEYRAKADWFAGRIRNFLKCCHESLNMDACTCSKLVDVASTNIFLGGKRGK